jgi:hypothetical protein
MIFLFLSAQCHRQSLKDKTLGNTGNRTMGGTIGALDTLVCPIGVSVAFIEFQLNLRVFHAVTFSALLYELQQLLALFVRQRNCVSQHMLSS